MFLCLPINLPKQTHPTLSIDIAKYIPGESAVILPPSITLLSSLSCCSITSWEFFHLWTIAGSINILACRRKVSDRKICRCIALNTWWKWQDVIIWNIIWHVQQWSKLFFTHSSFTLWSLKKEAPLMYTAAESSKFPAGVLSRRGWLFQIREYSQYSHSCSTDMNVPSLLVLTAHTRLHTAHTSNSSMRQFSYTMYFLISCFEVDSASLGGEGKNIVESATPSNSFNNNPNTFMKALWSRTKGWAVYWYLKYINIFSNKKWNEKLLWTSTSLFALKLQRICKKAARSRACYFPHSAYLSVPLRLWLTHSVARFDQISHTIWQYQLQRVGPRVARLGKISRPMWTRPGPALPLTSLFYIPFSAKESVKRPWHILLQLFDWFILKC